MKKQIAWSGLLLLIVMLLLIASVELLNRARLQSFLVSGEGDYSATFFRVKEISSLHLMHEKGFVRAKWSYMWNDPAELVFKKPIDIKESRILCESILHYMTNPPTALESDGA